jgi:hypothetical protein
MHSTAPQMGTPIMPPRSCQVWPRDCFHTILGMPTLVIGGVIGLSLNKKRLLSGSRSQHLWMGLAMDVAGTAMTATASQAVSSRG